MHQLHEGEIHQLKAEAELERHGMLLEQQRKDSRVIELEEKVRQAIHLDPTRNELMDID